MIWNIKWHHSSVISSLIPYHVLTVISHHIISYHISYQMSSMGLCIMFMSNVLTLCDAIRHRHSLQNTWELPRSWRVEWHHDYSVDTPTVNSYFVLTVLDSETMFTFVDCKMVFVERFQCISQSCGTFHEWFFIRNSNSIEISFLPWPRFRYNIFKWLENCAAVAFAKLCSDMIARKCIAT